MHACMTMQPHAQSGIEIANQESYHISMVDILLQRIPSQTLSEEAPSRKHHNWSCVYTSPLRLSTYATQG